MECTTRRKARLNRRIDGVEITFHIINIFFSVVSLCAKIKKKVSSCWCGGCSVLHWLEPVSRWVSVHNSPFMDYTHSLCSSSKAAETESSANKRKNEEKKRERAQLQVSNKTYARSHFSFVRPHRLLTTEISAVPLTVELAWWAFDANRERCWMLIFFFFLLFISIIHLTESTAVCLSLSDRRYGARSLCCTLQFDDVIDFSARNEGIFILYERNFIIKHQKKKMIVCEQHTCDRNLVHCEKIFEYLFSIYYTQ